MEDNIIIDKNGITIRKAEQDYLTLSRYSLKLVNNEKTLLIKEQHGMVFRSDNEGLSWILYAGTFNQVVEPIINVFRSR